MNEYLKIPVVALSSCMNCAWLFRRKIEFEIVSIFETEKGLKQSQ